MIFDSTGTKKIAALASYVIEGIEQGRILVVDELDSSIHFKLTRAMATMLLQKGIWRYLIVPNLFFCCLKTGSLLLYNRIRKKVWPGGRRLCLIKNGGIR